MVRLKRITPVCPVHLKIVWERVSVPLVVVLYSPSFFMSIVYVFYCVLYLYCINIVYTLFYMYFIMYLTLYLFCILFHGRLCMQETIFERLLANFWSEKTLDRKQYMRYNYYVGGSTQFGHDTKSIIQPSD